MAVGPWLASSAGAKNLQVRSTLVPSWARANDRAAVAPAPPTPTNVPRRMAWLGPLWGCLFFGTGTGATDLPRAAGRGTAVGVYKAARVAGTFALSNTSQPLA